MNFFCSFLDGQPNEANSTSFAFWPNEGRLCVQAPRRSTNGKKQKLGKKFNKPRTKLETCVEHRPHTPRGEWNVGVGAGAGVEAVNRQLSAMFSPANTITTAITLSACNTHVVTNRPPQKLCPADR